jgi:hypothetical protein
MGQLLAYDGVMAGLFANPGDIWLDGVVRGWWVDRILAEPVHSGYVYQLGQAALFAGRLVI